MGQPAFRICGLKLMTRQAAAACVANHLDARAAAAAASAAASASAAAAAAAAAAAQVPPIIASALALALGSKWKAQCVLELPPAGDV